MSVPITKMLFIGSAVLSHLHRLRNEMNQNSIYQGKELKNCSEPLETLVVHYEYRTGSLESREWVQVLSKAIDAKGGIHLLNVYAGMYTSVSELATPGPL